MKRCEASFYFPAEVQKGCSLSLRMPPSLLAYVVMTGGDSDEAAWRKPSPFLFPHGSPKRSAIFVPTKFLVLDKVKMSAPQQTMIIKKIEMT